MSFIVGRARSLSNIYRIMGFNLSILTFKFTGKTPLIKESTEVEAKTFVFSLRLISITSEKLI